MDKKLNHSIINFLKYLFQLFFLLLSFLNVFAQNNFEVVYMKNGSFIRGKIIVQADTSQVQIISIEGNTFMLSKTEVDSVKTNLKYKSLPGTGSTKEIDTKLPKEYKNIQQLPKSLIMGIYVGYAPNFLHSKGEYYFTDNYGEVQNQRRKGNMSAGFCYGLNSTRFFSKHLGMSFSINYLHKGMRILHDDYVTIGSHGSILSSTNTDIYIRNNSFKFSHSAILHHTIRNSLTVYLSLGYSLSFNKILWTEYHYHNLYSTQSDPLKANAGFYCSIGTYIWLNKTLFISLQFSNSEIFTKQNQQYTDLTLSTRSFDFGLGFMIPDKKK